MHANLDAGVRRVRSHGDQNHWDTASLCNSDFIRIVVREIFQNSTALLLDARMSFICSHGVEDD